MRVTGHDRGWTDGGPTTRLPIRSESNEYSYLGSPMREILYKITERCPCMCAFCKSEHSLIMNAKNTPITLDDWIRASKTFIANGMRIAIISGGEPLVEARKTLEIVRFLVEQDVYVVLNASGVTFLKKSVTTVLQGVRPSLLIFSLDSAYASTHDTSRRVPGLFQAIFRAIEECVSELRLPVGVRFVITNQNYKELPDVIKMCKKARVDCLKITNIEDDPDRVYTLSVSQLREFDADIRRGAISAFLENTSENSELVQDGVSKLKGILNSSDTDYEAISRGEFLSSGRGAHDCGMLDRFAVVKSNGELVPCCEAEYHNQPIVGNVVTGDAHGVLDASAMAMKMHGSDLCRTCTKEHNAQLNFTSHGLVVDDR
ncbi:MAG: radical SAM/SPASM domain-containing protein [Pseudomonadota bacterium]